MSDVGSLPFNIELVGIVLSETYVYMCGLTGAYMHSLVVFNRRRLSGDGSRPFHNELVGIVLSEKV